MPLLSERGGHTFDIQKFVEFSNYMTLSEKCLAFVQFYVQNKLLLYYERVLWGGFLYQKHNEMKLEQCIFLFYFFLVFICNLKHFKTFPFFCSSGKNVFLTFLNIHIVWLFLFVIDFSHFLISFQSDPLWA